MHSILRVLSQPDRHCHQHNVVVERQLTSASIVNGHDSMPEHCFAVAMMCLAAADVPSMFS